MKQKDTITENPFVQGQVLLIDKPLSWTSFDVVNKIRSTIKKHTRIKKIKVGHAGTLDPLATGLLIVCTGKFTKKIADYQAQKKEYTGSITIGATTPSYDMETDIDQQYPIHHITETMLYTAAKQLEGEIWQTPPAYSAKKVNGKIAYQVARKGESITLKPHRVFVHQFLITQIDLPRVDFKITCSKGTYIRSIAHDFGKKLQSGAYLSSLRRTAIGTFSVENAMKIDEAVDFIKKQGCLLSQTNIPPIE